MTVHSYKGEYRHTDPEGTLWDPLGAWWSAPDGPGDTFRATGVVTVELQPNDGSRYLITIYSVRGDHGSYALGVSLFTPYNLCALLPLVGTDGCEENTYVLDKFNARRRGIPESHRCARVLISRLAGLASDIEAAR